MPGDKEGFVKALEKHGFYLAKDGRCDYVGAVRRFYRLKNDRASPVSGSGYPFKGPANIF